MIIESLHCRNPTRPWMWDAFFSAQPSFFNCSRAPRSSMFLSRKSYWCRGLISILPILVVTQLFTRSITLALKKSPVISRRRCNLWLGWALDVPRLYPNWLKHFFHYSTSSVRRLFFRLEVAELCEDLTVSSIRFFQIGIALEEMGIDYNPHTIHIGKNEQFTPEFIAINPNSKIPAITDPNGPGLAHSLRNCSCCSGRFKFEWHLDIDSLFRTTVVAISANELRKLMKSDAASGRFEFLSVDINVWSDYCDAQMGNPSIFLKVAPYFSTSRRRLENSFPRSLDWSGKQFNGFSFKWLASDQCSDRYDLRRLDCCWLFIPIKIISLLLILFGKHFDFLQLELTYGHWFNIIFLCLHIVMKFHTHPVPVSGNKHEMEMKLKIFNTICWVLYVLNCDICDVWRSLKYIRCWPWYCVQFGHFYKFAKDKCDHPYPVQRYSTEVKRLLGVLDKQLEGKEFLVGNEYSIADMASFPWVRAMEKDMNAAEILGLSNFPNVTAWVDRLQERPATAKGITVCPFGWLEWRI